VTEADWNAWTEGQLSVYLETVLEAFGPRRVMFGTDWPVCLLATSYARWYDLVRNLCAKLSPTERDRVFGETAIEAYNL
jgi:L-fuconolactonase